MKSDNTSKINKLDKLIMPRKDAEVNADAEDVSLWRKQSVAVKHEYAKTIANKQAVDNPSDPTIYDRTYSHIMNGILTPLDFKVKWNITNNSNSKIASGALGV